MPAVGSQKVLKVVISADVTGFVNGLHTAQRKLEQTSRSMIAIGQNLAFAIGVPIAGLGTTVIKMANDFENAGNRIVTQTNVTRQNVEALGGSVTKLSDSLGVDKIQLMEAALAIASAGMTDTRDIMEALSETAKLTTIGLGDQETVARALTSVMQAYGAENVNAKRAANAFLLAVKEGNFRAPQFAESIGEIVGISSAMNISIEQIVAGISAYSRVIGDAGRATIGFRNILSDILSPSQKAIRLWDQLFRTTGGKGVVELRKALSKDLVGTLKQVADAMSGMPEVADLLFDNVRGLEAFLSVFESQGDEVLNIFRRIVGETDAVDKAWNQLLESGRRVWSVVRSQVVNLAVAIGDVLFPAVKDVGFQFAGWLNVLRPVIVDNTKLIVQVLGLTAAFIAVTLALGTFGLLVSTAWRALNLLAVVISEVVAGAAGLAVWLATPWGAVIGAITAIIALMVTFGEEAGATAREVTTTWDRLFAILWAGLKAGFLSFVVFVEQRMAATFDKIAAWAKESEKEGGFLFSWLGGDRVDDVFAEGAKRLRAGSERWADEIARLKAEITVQFQGLIKDAFALDPSQLKFAVLPKEEIEALRDEWKGLKPFRPQIVDVESLRTNVDAAIAEWTRAVGLTREQRDELQQVLGDLNLAKPTGLVDDEAAKKIASAWEKVTQTFRDQSIELRALDGNWSEFTAETIQKVTEIEEALVGLVPRDVIEQVKLAFREMRKEAQPKVILKEAFGDLTEMIKDQAVELGELTSQMTEFDKETERGLRTFDEWTQKLRDASGTDTQLAEVERLRQAYINLRYEIEKQNRAIVFDLKSALNDAISSVTRAIFSGTQDWRDYLEIFSDIGVGIFIDMFRQIIEKKIEKLDIPLKINLDDLAEALGKIRAEIEKVGEMGIPGTGAVTPEEREIERQQTGGVTVDFPQPTFPTGGAPTGPQPAIQPGWLDALWRQLEILQDWLADIWEQIQVTAAEVRDAVMSGFNALIGYMTARDKAAAKLAKRQAIVSAIGSSAGALLSAYGGGGAKGGGAKGGIATGPTFGVIGEAGMEALIPLSRLANYMDIGRGLDFDASETTVIVNSPHPAQVRETQRDDEKMIEVIIDNAMARSFRQGGKAASALERSYGVRRQGGTR